MSERADRLAAAGARARPRPAARLGLRQRALADGLHRLQRARDPRHRATAARRASSSRTSATSRRPPSRSRRCGTGGRRPRSSWGRRWPSTSRSGTARACRAWASTTPRITVAELERVRDAIGDRAELVPAGGLVERLREVKDAGEVSRIREAAHLADHALTEVLGRGLAGRTEAQIALDLEVTIRRHGAEAHQLPADRRERRARRAPARRPARRRHRARRARDDRLGRAARRLLLGLHADVRRRRRARGGGARGVRARARGAGGGARRGPPGAAGPRGRRGRARHHRRRGPRRALRARPRVTASGSRSTRARGSRGSARPRWRRAWSSRSSPGCTSRGAAACGSRTSPSSRTTGADVLNTPAEGPAGRRLRRARQFSAARWTRPSVSSTASVTCVHTAMPGVASMRSDAAAPPTMMPTAGSTARIA